MWLVVSQRHDEKENGRMEEGKEEEEAGTKYYKDYGAGKGARY
jgi:hypothetical protein